MLVLFLSPLSCGDILGESWWIYAILSLFAPYCAYKQNASKGEWLTAQIIGFPILFMLYLFMDLNLTDMPQILLAYFVSLPLYTLSLLSWNFNKDRMKLRKEIKASYLSDTILIEGIYDDSTEYSHYSMPFYSNEILLAEAHNHSLFEVDNHSFFNFFMFSSKGEKYCFQKEIIPFNNSFLSKIMPSSEYIKGTYILKLGNSSLTISKDGLISFPDGDSAHWDWKLRSLYRKIIILHTAQNNKIQLQFYPGKGVLCILQGAKTDNLVFASIALAFFYHLLGSCIYNTRSQSS